MNLNTPVRVELHTWIDGTPQHVESVVDVTRFVSSLSWTDSLRAPWTEIRLQLAIPYRMVRDIIPGRRVPHGKNFNSNTNQLPKNVEQADPRYGYVPEPGFWVVIRNLTPFGIVGTSLGNDAAIALAFGRCTDVSFGVAARQSSGLTMTMPVSIRAESFLAFTGRSQMQYSPQGTGSWGMDGFVWDIQNWSDNLSAKIKAVISGKPGDLLAELWRDIVRLELPPSLTPGAATAVDTLGSLVPIVKDEASASSWTPMRTKEVHPVVGGVTPATGAGISPNYPSLLTFFMSTFYANHEAVELFSTLDFPAAGTSGQLTPLGKALGVQPVVIYRLKPWFIEAVTRDVVRKTSESANPGEAASKLTMPMVGIGEAASRKEGAGGVQWFEWARDEIVNAQVSWSDAERANLVFGSWCFATTDQPSSYGLTGTPIVPDTTTIKRHGLRVYGMRWPFFQTGQGSTAQIAQKVGDVAGAASNLAAAGGSNLLAGALAAASAVAKAFTPGLIDYNDAIIELAWMMAGDGQRWCRGSFSGLYKPQVKPGHWAVVRFFDSVLTCYIEAVSHSLSVDQSSGHIIKESVVSFSRGTLRHQDAPSYQYRLETKGSNPPGAPVRLQTTSDLTSLVRGAYGSAEGAVANLLEYARKAASPIAEGEFIIYTSPIPLFKPAAPAVQVSQVSQLRRLIVVHITEGQTLYGMMKQFAKQRTYENKKTGKKSIYYTSTHYSIEKDGRIIQWMDPMKYNANHTAGAEFPEKSVGIDVLGDGYTVTPQQERSLAVLIQYIRSLFPNITNTVVPDNATYVDSQGLKTSIQYKTTTGQLVSSPSDPTVIFYTMTDVTKNLWGIGRHRNFNRKDCPRAVPIEGIVAIDISRTTRKVTNLDPAVQKQLETWAKQLGLI